MKRKSVREVIENPQEDEYYVLVTRYYPMYLRMFGMKLDSSPFATWDRELAPSKDLLWDYKYRRLSWQEYTVRFKKEVPLSLIKERLEIHIENAGNKTVVLVCIEENDKFPKCHTWTILAMLDKMESLRK